MQALCEMPALPLWVAEPRNNRRVSADVCSEDCRLFQVMVGLLEITVEEFRRLQTQACGGIVGPTVHAPLRVSEQPSVEEWASGGLRAARI